MRARPRSYMLNEPSRYAASTNKMIITMITAAVSRPILVNGFIPRPSDRATALIVTLPAV
jgi:hypothetical protein